MLLFSVAVAVFLLVLAWAEEIVGVFVGEEVMVRGMDGLVLGCDLRGEPC